MRKLLTLIFLASLSLFIVSCGQGVNESNLVGSEAPDFTLTDLKGKTWTLSELKGQVVFINFWATWCPPCREEMPAMQQLLDLLPKDKFKMLAILNKDSTSNAELFVQKNKLSMPILNDMANNIGPMYGLTGLPETFIVDKQGIVREKYIGPAQWFSPEIVQRMFKYINE